MRHISKLRRIGTTVSAVGLMSTIHASDKPNILIILADDLGYGDVGYHGCTEIPTPNIDSIAKNGISFSTGYAAAPVCGPSRVGLVTGRYQNRFGYHDNLGPYVISKDVEPGIPTIEKTIGNRFKKLGYATGMIGKWHDGEDEKFQPHMRGFDEYLGFNNGAANYFIGPNNATAKKSGAIYRNGKRAENVGDYLTDVFGDEAVDFIDRHNDEPFMLYLAFNAVHGPLQAPQRYLSKFKHIKNPKRRTMVAMDYCMDLNIGKVLDKLREHNIEENTLIFFASDNGGKPKGNFSFNGVLRGQKGTVYEGGIRVPFCVQWKGTIPAGQKSDTPVHLLDILPTSIKAVGAKVDPLWKLDGVNILPLMTGEKKLAKRDLFWRINTQSAIRNKDWKLLTQNGVKQLFHISKDISEKNDVLLEYPEIAQQLQKKMDKWDSENIPVQCGWNKGLLPVWIGTHQWEHEADLLAHSKKSRNK